MKRWDILNAAIQKNGYKNYLEIGLDSGICRDNVHIENKTTVDPSNVCVVPTHNMTSDDFFAQNKDSFDIIFIDGLHEAGQVLKDINNALDCLNSGGSVFCHDMLPTSEAVQAVPRVSSIWTGDCWKAWAKLKGTREDLKMYIFQDDWGVGLIKNGAQNIYAELNVPIENMNWSFYQKNKNKFGYIGRDKLNDVL